MIKRYLYVILLGLFVGCNESNRTFEKASYMIDLNLDTLQTEDTVKISAFFKTVNTIILEDHEYAVIGEIHAIQIFEDNIFVLDKWKAKKLFVFDKQGKYLRQIGDYGQAPGEYLGISDFCIDIQNREIYLLDDNGKKIHKYKIDNGKFMKSIPLPTDVTCRYIAYFQGDLYCSIRPYDKTNNNLLMKITASGKYAEYLNADKYNAGFNRLLSNGYNFFVSKTEQPRYVELFMNTVFSFDKDTVYPFVTVMHKDWVRKGDFLSEEEYMKQQIIERFDLSRKGRAFTIRNYFEWQDNIFFQYWHGFGTPLSVLYNKKTGNICQYKYMKNDLLFQNRTDARFLHVNSTAAYDYYDSEWFASYYIAENGLISNLDLLPNLDKREELIKLQPERFIIFEYVFK
ncbi:MAG: 6-bladed beta-propeller [Prevotellaceae bacterium]|jgi:hypothetical protein|nr:6-bladed beta-propeller [Prevotellaceae bacterium]